MENQVISSVGRKDQYLTLIKLELKEGKTSGKKVGNKENLVLGGPISIGRPITKIKQIGESRKKPPTFPATSEVLNIESLENNIYKIETLTSFYRAKLV